MQPDQSEDILQATAPFPRIPRSRPGTRRTMRSTSRYTMPPLVPRAPQQPASSDWDAQNYTGSPMAKHEEMSSGRIAAMHAPVDTEDDDLSESLDEDAWLNDVSPAPKLNHSPNRPTARMAPPSLRESIGLQHVQADKRDRHDARDGRGSEGHSQHAAEAVDPVLPGHRLWPVVHRLSERVCQELALRPALSEGSDADAEEAARTSAVHVLRAEPALADQIYNLTEAEQVMQAVIDEVWGFGPLAALLRDESVTEIMAVGPRLTTIERDGDMLDVPYHFQDEKHMTRIVGNILRQAGHEFDPGIAITNARLPDSTFVNVVMPPSAVKGPTITMRKRRTSVPTLAELVSRGTLSQSMGEYLQMCVRMRQNIVICGGLRSGRTTLLNALVACIPDAERIVTLEDVAELQLHQKQVVSLEARLMGPESGERKRRNTGNMRDLLLCALRMRPERVILGDCWNDEAGVLLSALHAGYAGSLFSVYANGLQDCLSRLEMMWLTSRPGVSLSNMREQLARSIHLVIYLARLTDGARKVMNIAEVLGVEGERIKVRSIFHYLESSNDAPGMFEQNGFAPSGMVQARHSQRSEEILLAQWPKR